MTKELKNDRDVLQALLDGETIQRTRQNNKEVLEWYLSNDKIVSPTNAEIVPYFIDGICIKPKTININGYEVPEPLREEPKIGKKLYKASWATPEWEIYYNKEYILDFNAGFLHLSKEAAVEHRKALESFTTLRKEGENEDI